VRCHRKRASESCRRRAVECGESESERRRPVPRRALKAEPIPVRLTTRRLSWPAWRRKQQRSPARASLRRPPRETRSAASDDRQRLHRPSRVDDRRSRHLMSRVAADDEATRSRLRSFSRFDLRITAHEIVASVARRGLNVIADRTYLSRTIGGTPFGAGWGSMLFRRLRVLPNGNVEYRDGSGEVWFFRYAIGADSGYFSPQGVFLKLSRTASGWVMVDQQLRQTQFDALGRLKGAQSADLLDAASQLANQQFHLRMIGGPRTIFDPFIGDALTSRGITHSFQRISLPQIWSHIWLGY